jgi:hypothetical protein
MPWVKLTDDWYDDPKIAALDDHGIALWVIGITWCARNLTDGHIPAGAVRRLVADPDRAVDQAETSPRPSHPVPVPVVDTSSQRYSRRSPQPSARVPLSESEHPVVVAQRLREQGSVVPVASQDAHQAAAARGVS